MPCNGAQSQTTIPAKERNLCDRVREERILQNEDELLHENTSRSEYFIHSE